jgi:hypothetical protein
MRYEFIIHITEMFPGDGVPYPVSEYQWSWSVARHGSGDCKMWVGAQATEAEAKAAAEECCKKNDGDYPPQPREPKDYEYTWSGNETS